MSSCLVICAKRFNGHELFTLLGILNQRGHDFEVVSQDTLIRDEKTLRPNTIERTVWQVYPEEEVTKRDAVIVVSGNQSDTEAYWVDPHVENILKAFRGADKITAAICCSVPTLAPIVRGIKVSFFPLIRSRHRLQKAGALLQPTSMTIDGNTITAENQMLSQMWAEEICNKLEGKPQQHTFVPTWFKPKGHERMMQPEIRQAIDEARGYKMVLRKPKPAPKPEQDNG